VRLALCKISSVWVPYCYNDEVNERRIRVKRGNEWNDAVTISF
jgi:hypothetical protein